jgi:hypothetical protein
MQLIFVSFRLFSGPQKMIFAVLVVFCSRFMADQKSSQVATNLVYSSAHSTDAHLCFVIRHSDFACRAVASREGGSLSEHP